MLSSLDITRLLAESAGDIIGGEIASIEYYRKERALQVYVKTDRVYCLTLSFHPQRSGFFILPAGRSRLDTKEKHRPFARELTGGTIKALIQVANDRMVEMAIEQSEKVAFIVFEIIGPNGDAVLLNADRKVVTSLKGRKGIEGKPYEMSPLPAKVDPFAISGEIIANLFAEKSDIDPLRALEKHIYGLDYYLARTFIETDSNPGPIADAIADLVSRYQSSDGPIYAYRIKGKTVFYPIKIAGFEPAEKYKSLNQAQRDAVIESKAEDEAESFADLTIKSVKAKVKKAERLVIKMESDIKEAADFERYLQYADLLKIHIAKLKRGMESLSVPDLYNESVTIDIPLDSKLNGPDNIEWYSKRYRKGKEGLELLIRRKANVTAEIAFLKEALQAFEGNFENAKEYYPELLPVINDGRPADVATRKPYKEYQTSTGLTILVGKTGADNDRTTFEYARPYELWFHASQCPGSHVVMKYPHKNFEPSKLEIEETAAAAAWASKSRGSGKVPVSYTEKKYVRKPRKAKSGLVTIERETTILVVPRELEKKGD